MNTSKTSYLELLKSHGIGKMTPELQDAFRALLAKAGWIHDAEMDDAVLGAILGLHKNPMLRVCTEDKDGGPVRELKTTMMKAVVGKTSDFEITMENDYRLSAEEKTKRNQEIIAKESGTLKKFCDRLATDWDVVPVILTAPPFGIMAQIQKYIEEKTLVVFAYTGSYNLQYMGELMELAAQDKAFVIDTSRYRVIANPEGKEPNRLRGFYKMMKPTNFWEMLGQTHPEKRCAFQDFMHAFNGELLRPGRLFDPHKPNSALDDDATMSELNGLFDVAVTSKGIHKTQLDVYCATVLASHMKSIKGWKKTMLKHVDKEGPACDMFIGLMVFCDPADITVTTGEWKLINNGRFSDVDPKGNLVNAMTWKVDMSNEPFMVQQIVDTVVMSLLQDGNPKPPEKTGPALKKPRV